MAASSESEPAAGAVETEVAPGPLSRLLGGTRQRLAGIADPRLAGIAAGLARHHPREVTAVVLLAAGAAFPPVWLLGALIVLGSGAWDHRDKWLSLALPVGVVILISVLIPAVMPHGSAAAFAWSVWLLGGRLSRAAALVSGGYLAWRLHRGPRVPKVPPWNIPHRFG